MDKGKILLVDDETTILNFLKALLTIEGFLVYTATSGLEAIAICKKYKPDLLLLDIMMPELDGFETCSKIREISEVPIIFLSAKNQTQDRIMGLACGSDDYIIKPFDSTELLLRVKAVLRRTRGLDGLNPEGGIKSQGITVNRYTRTVKKNQQEVELTAKEFDLLWLLINHPQRVFTRDQLVYQIWNSDFFEDTAAINMLVKRLRDKIEDNPAKPKYIQTIRGVGYKFGCEHC